MVKVDGWSDWTVTPSWIDGSRSMTATIGHGLPMTYFKVTGGGAQLTLNASPRIWQNDGATVGFTVNGHDYVAYAPTGAGWTVVGQLDCVEPGRQGLLHRRGAADDRLRAPTATDSRWPRSSARYAYATVTGTSMSYRYDQASSTVVTTYGFTTTPAEGTETRTVDGALSASVEVADRCDTHCRAVCVTARTDEGAGRGRGSSRTSMTFHGVLPEVPAVADSSGADGQLLDGYLQEVAADPMAMQKADTYWAGKGLGRAARIAEIADQVGETPRCGTRRWRRSASTLTDWFTASPGKSEQLFYYDKNWGTLIGYPASYGSDQELNDHHFHYGYFIAAAATLARFDPDLGVDRDSTAAWSIC